MWASVSIGIEMRTPKTNTIAYTIKLKSNLKIQFGCITGLVA